MHLKWFNSKKSFFNVNKYYLKYIKYFKYQSELFQQNFSIIIWRWKCVETLRTITCSQCPSALGDRIYFRKGRTEWIPAFVFNGPSFLSGITGTCLVCAYSPWSAETDILDFLCRIHPAVRHDVHGAFHAWCLIGNHNYSPGSSFFSPVGSNSSQG